MLSLFKNLRKTKTPLVYTDQRVQVKKRLENELAAGRILQHMDQALLVACRHSLTPPTRLIAIQKLWADDYAVYLSFEQYYTDALVHQICITLKHEVEKVLNRKITHSHISNIEVHIGYAKIEGLDLAKDMYSSVKLASQMAKCGFMSEEFRQMQEFRRIMEQEDIHTVIQPIVSLKTGIPLGWETLVRGPENSHFHSPGRDSAPITEQAINKLRQLQEERSMILFEEPSGKIGDIVRSTVCVSQDTLVREVHHIFERNAKIDSIVVLEDRVPRGLIMRFQLYKILGGQYGIALYYEKPVSQLMNHSPLIVDRCENIELVAKTAMERQSFHLYDVIIITEKNQYIGVVTVQSLLDMLAKAKLEIAAVSNPLTGLPGNVRIDR